IQALLRSGRRDAVPALLLRIAAEQPLARRVYTMRAELAEAAGDFTAAVQHCARWLELCPDDDEVLVAQSRRFGRLGDREHQLEALRAAIECNPNRRDDQRYLEFLAAEA